MCLPRTLLLSGTAPGSPGVGGIVLGDLASLFPPGHLSTFVTQELTATADPASLKRLVRLLARGGRIGRGAAATLRSITNRLDELEALKAAESQGLAHGAELLWAVLASPTAIGMAYQLAKRLKVPLVTTVWDDVSHNIRYFQLDRLAARHLQVSFDEALLASRACAVISESMKDSYQQRYGVQCVVVRHGLPTNLHPSVCSEPAATGPIRIGFAGSVTARSAFETLLEALDSLGWEIDGRPISLRLLGLRFVLQSFTPRRIEVLGYQSSVAEAVDRLAECSINYLPQPFEPDWVPFSKLSFPTKLTTYLAAGAPILLHTPSYGSLYKFFDRYPFGVRVNSLDPLDIANALKELITSQKLIAKAREQVKRGFYQEFAADCFHLAFKEFIDRAALLQ